MKTKLPQFLFVQNGNENNNFMGLLIRSELMKLSWHVAGTGYILVLVLIIIHSYIKIDILKNLNNDPKT